MKIQATNTSLVVRSNLHTMITVITCLVALNSVYIRAQNTTDSDLESLNSISEISHQIDVLLSKKGLSIFEVLDQNLSQIDIDKLEQIEWQKYKILGVNKINRIVFPFVFNNEGIYRCEFDKSKTLVLDCSLLTGYPQNSKDQKEKLDIHFDHKYILAFSIDYKSIAILDLQIGRAHV